MTSRYALHSLLIATLLFCCCGMLHAQERFVGSTDAIAVDPGDGSRLLNPLAGGLISARIGLLDVDGDGLPELLALNPDGRPRLYHNEGNFRFRRAPATPYDSLPVRLWFRVVDLDGDGAVDLLTGGEHSELLWYPNRGTTARPRFGMADTLRHDTIIFTQQETVPSLVDIDNDGDLDLFSGNVEGSITFYRNIGTRTVPNFLLVSSQYADILVRSNRTRRDKPDPSGLLGSLHGASVLDFADLDGDGDLDLLFGDFFTERLLLFHNDGTSTSATFSMARLDTAFRGIGDDVGTLGFNQPVVADIDGDGDLDVLVSSLYPNSPFQSIYLYENVGSKTAPNIKKRPEEITSELDLGAYSSPTWIDDADHRGVLVGNSDGNITLFSYSIDGVTPLLRREGRYATIPGLFNAVPTAGDIDGDGRAEIIVGSADGNNLVLMRIQGSRLVQGEWNLDTLRAGRYSSPCLVDFDGDLDLDLFVGSSGGRIAYFENIGTRTSPMFVSRTAPSPFDTLDLGSNSAPRLFDCDGDGDLDMVVGLRPDESRDRGIIRFYLNTNGTFSQKSDWSDIPTDIFPTPMLLALPRGLALLVGDRPGGLQCYIDSSYSLGVNDGASPGDRGDQALKLLPNVLPTIGGTLRVDGVVFQAGTGYRLIDPIGRELFRGTMEGSIVRIPPLPQGMYILRLERSSPTTSGTNASGTNASGINASGINASGARASGTIVVVGQP